jgi:hypothetical protein
VDVEMEALWTSAASV